MTKLRVRQGDRVGYALAVLRYTAVVLWDGDKERDVAWLCDLEVIGYGETELDDTDHRRAVLLGVEK